MKKLSKLFLLLFVIFLFSQNIKAKKNYTLRKQFGHNVVDVSPDGKIIAEGCSDGTIKLWNIKTDKCFKTFKYYKKIYLIMFTPNGKSFLTLAKDGPVVLWDIATEKYLVCNHNDNLFLPEFSPNGEIMLTVYNNVVYLWDLQEYSLLKTLTVSCEEPVCKAIFSSSGKNIFIFRSYYYEKSSVFDSSEKLQPVYYNSSLRYFDPIVISEDRTKVLIFLGFYDAKLYEITDDGLSQIYFFSRINSAAFSSDGKMIIITHYSDKYGDRSTKLFDLLEDHCLKTFNSIKKIAFFSNGTKILTVNANNIIEVYCIMRNNRLLDDNINKDIICSRSFDYNSNVLSVDYSSDGKMILATYEDNKIRLLDVEKGKLLQTFKYDTKDCAVSFYIKDENLILVSGKEGMDLWEKKK